MWQGSSAYPPFFVHCGGGGGVHNVSGPLHEIGKNYNILNIIEIELVFGVNPSLDIFDLRLMSRNVVKCQRSIIGPSDQRGNEETQLFDTLHGYFLQNTYLIQYVHNQY